MVIFSAYHISVMQMKVSVYQGSEVCLICIVIESGIHAEAKGAPF